jgi:hypothetical protein
MSPGGQAPASRHAAGSLALWFFLVDIIATGIPAPVGCTQSVATGPRAEILRGVLDSAALLRPLAYTGVGERAISAINRDLGHCDNLNMQPMSHEMALERGSPARAQHLSAMRPLHSRAIL